MKTDKIEWQNFVNEWCEGLKVHLKYHILGTLFYNISNFKKAIEYLENSLKINEDIGDKVVESKCYTNLGVAYNGLSDFKKEIEYHLKAEKIFKEIGQEHCPKILYKIIAILYKIITIIYEKLNMNEKAEEYKRKAKK